VRRHILRRQLGQLVGLRVDPTQRLHFLQQRACRRAMSNSLHSPVPVTDPQVALPVHTCAYHH
jgi:hypothetical protein